MSQNVYLSKLFVETEKGNQLMSQICPQAYAYLPWKPYILDTEEEEALFTRDVINYYSVIGDSFNYFWHDHIIFLQEKYCDFKEKLKEGKNNYYEIQHMRTFLSHRFDKRNIKYFEAYCKFIESNQSVDDFISENENDINFILFSGINWKKANENLYKKTCYIVHTYNDILSQIVNADEKQQEEFINNWKDAVASWYSKNNDIKGCIIRWEKWAIDEYKENGKKIHRNIKNFTKKINKSEILKIMQNEKNSYDFNVMFPNYLESNCLNT